MPSGVSRARTDSEAASGIDSRPASEIDLAPVSRDLCSQYDAGVRHAPTAAAHETGQPLIEQHGGDQKSSALQAVRA